MNSINKERAIEKLESPFIFYKCTNLIEPALRDVLLDSYPENGFERVSKSGLDKTYSFEINNIIIENEIINSFNILDSIWKNFIQFISSTEYKKWLGDSMGLNLENNKISVGFYRFQKEDAVSPHLDKENKILTQLFYFNRQWPKDWGGQLKLLSSPKMDSDALSIYPNVNYSVILHRSKHAWHAVHPVSINASSPRKTLQLEIWH